MDNIVNKAEDNIQNAILTEGNNIITLRIELSLRSKNASTGRDTAIFTPNSENEECKKDYRLPWRCIRKENHFHELNKKIRLEETLQTR